MENGFSSASSSSENRSSIPSDSADCIAFSTSSLIGIRASRPLPKPLCLLAIYLFTPLMISEIFLMIFPCILSDHFFGQLSVGRRTG